MLFAREGAKILLVNRSEAHAQKLCEEISHEGGICSTFVGDLTLEEDVTLGHLAMVHGCHVGAGALIGMKATVLNGARVGSGALIGAGSLLPEGREIEGGKLALGSPAKAVRDLSEAEIQRCRATAAHYQRNAQRYRDGLSGVE